MKMRKIISISMVLLFSFCFNLRVEAKIFDMSEFDLDNGLKVIVIPNHKAPIIKHMVWYKVGSVDEVLGQSGKAHLLEHLMFRGTKKVKDSEFNTIIDKNGGESNAFTSLDFTAYYQMLDITRLEIAMALEADRMENLVISAESLEKEREIVFQERKQMIDNNPVRYFEEVLRSSLWFRHPYGRPVIGTDDEILNFKLDQVMGFYKKFYTPSNAILILSGDIDVDTAKKLANKYYGKVKNRKIAERPFIEPIDKPFSKRLEMSLEGVSSERLIKSYIVPSYNLDKSKIYPLMVLSKYLGEGETSKLYKDLVFEKKAALTISTSYDGFTKSYGSFRIYAIPSAGSNVLELEKNLDIALKKAIKSISAVEIEKVKHNMLAGLIYIKDNPEDAAYIVGSMATIGMSIEEIANYDEEIKKLSLDEVKAAADELFGKNTQNITGVLTPKKGEK